MPVPSAWKLALRTMPTAAKGKDQLMIRRAVHPMLLNCSEGSKMSSSAPGTIWKANRPKIITLSATPRARFRVPMIRFGSRAP